MSSVNNVGSSAPLQRIATPQPVQKQAATGAAQSPRATDKLELSGTSHLLAALKKGGDMRLDKVAEIKSQIEAGKYEDDKKLDAAVDRLLEDLLK